MAYSFLPYAICYLPYAILRFEIALRAHSPGFRWGGTRGGLRLGSRAQGRFMNRPYKLSEVGSLIGAHGDLYRIQIAAGVVVVDVGRDAVGKLAVDIFPSVRAVVNVG